MVVRPDQVGGRLLLDAAAAVAEAAVERLGRGVEVGALGPPVGVGRAEAGVGVALAVPPSEAPVFPKPRAYMLQKLVYAICSAAWAPRAEPNFWPRARAVTATSGGKGSYDTTRR